MGELTGVARELTAVAQETGRNWTAINGDCVEVLRGWGTETVHLSVFSPPYLSLYVYSASARDLGNASSDAEFWEHFGFVITELLRVTKPGRIVAVDCMNVPAMKERDGYIGLKDFRGDIIWRFRKEGFIFHSEHCVWKDPLIEATRTKALGLMHKQLCKDSSMVRAGLPQYLLAFRKPGTNEEPIAHPTGLETFTGEDAPKHGNLSHERWRRYASPVWMDIDFGRTLNVAAAREGRDERHVCPMALDMIDRALELYSAPGEVVLDPFGGIGSTPVSAVRAARRAVAIELKESYWREMVRNLRAAEQTQATLFSGASA